MPLSRERWWHGTDFEWTHALIGERSVGNPGESPRSLRCVPPPGFTVVFGQVPRPMDTAGHWYDGEESLVPISVLSVLSEEAFQLHMASRQTPSGETEGMTTQQKFAHYLDVFRQMERDRDLIAAERRRQSEQERLLHAPNGWRPSPEFVIATCDGNVFLAEERGETLFNAWSIREPVGRLRDSCSFDGLRHVAVEVKANECEVSRRFITEAAGLSIPIWPRGWAMNEVPTLWCGTTTHAIAQSIYHEGAATEIIRQLIAKSRWQCSGPIGAATAIPLESIARFEY